MNKKSAILKAPAILLLVGSVGAGFYAANKGIGDIGYGAPIVLLLILVLYGIGCLIDSQGKQNAEGLPEPTGASREIDGENLVNRERDTTVTHTKAPDVFDLD